MIIKLGSKRVLVTLSGKAFELLEGVQSDLGARSKIEIIRFAVSLYLSIYKKTGEGYELCLKKGEELRMLNIPSEFLPEPDPLTGSFASQVEIPTHQASPQISNIIEP